MNRKYLNLQFFISKYSVCTIFHFTIYDFIVMHIFRLRVGGCQFLHVFGGKVYSNQSSIISLFATKNKLCRVILKLQSYTKNKLQLNKIYQNIIVFIHLTVCRFGISLSFNNLVQNYALM